MPLRLILIIIFIIIGFITGGSRRSRTARNNNSNTNTVSRPGKPDYVRSSQNDPEMDKAVATAPATVQQFIDALKSPKPNQRGFSIKKGFKQGEMTEHMWMTDVTFDGTNFHGKLNNDPVDVTNIKIGDAVTLSPKEISDWMFVEDGKLVGGYTLRVLYSRESPEGKKQIDRETGFKIE